MQDVITKIVALDRNLFSRINGFAGKWKFLDVMGIMFAEGIVYLIGSGLIISILTIENTSIRLRLIIEAILAGLLARFGFVSLIRMLDFRYRPFWYQNVTQLVPHNPYEASFPSGHAAVMGAIVVLMFFIDKKLAVIFAVLAVISGVARVFVGVHFIFDIIAGFACGVFSALIVKFFSRFL